MSTAGAGRVHGKTKAKVQQMEIQGSRGRGDETTTPRTTGGRATKPTRAKQTRDAAGNDEREADVHGPDSRCTGRRAQTGF